MNEVYLVISKQFINEQFCLDKISDIRYKFLFEFSLKILKNSNNFICMNPLNFIYIYNYFFSINCVSQDYNYINDFYFTLKFFK